MTSQTVAPSTGPLSVTEVITLEEVGPLRYRGRTQPGPNKRTYGGEVAGQAVLAATRTVPADRFVHSAHMHFLLPGDTSEPIEFVVERTRDGGSFTARRVEAVQRDRVIFTMTASFQDRESGISHAASPVDVPPPEGLPTPAEMFAGDPENLRWVRWLLESNDLDARFPTLPARSAAAEGLRVEAKQSAWIRALHRISDDEHEQAAALAYVSDLLLLSTALGPSGYTLQDGRLQFATIDHTVWFHAPLRVDEWFLYDQESRWAGNSRALCHGEIYDRTSRLCVTTMQEGLLRVRPAETDR
ncbi:acyl-CoA thioesterase [Nocardioides pacificus]